MATRLRPIAQDAFRMTIAGIETVFSKFEGGEEKYETGDYVDPTDRRKKKVKSALEVENITLTKIYNPIDDAPLVDLWQKDQASPKDDYTATKQAIKKDKEQTALGRPTTYYGCQLVRFKYPDGDVESSETAMLEIELSVDYATTA